MRMLMNNLDPEVAEHPDQLIVYGGSGRAARSWAAFDADRRDAAGPRGRRDAAGPVRQAGRRAAHPRVGAAGADRQLQPGPAVGHLGGVPPAGVARADHVRPDDRRLVDLHRHPGHPAGHLRDVRRGRGQALRRHAGRHDHADRRAGRHGRRAAARGDDERRRGHLHRLRPVPDRPPDRVRLPGRGRRRHRRRAAPGHRGPGRGRAAVHRPARQRRRDRARSCSARSAPIDIVTDQTSAHDPLSYLPARRRRSRTWPRCAPRTRPASPRGPGESMAAHVEAMVGFLDAGAEVFDYGNSIRGEAELAGYERAFAFPGFVPAYIRPLFCEGKGPFRWAALSGDPADIAATDRAILDLFPGNEPLARWIRMAAGEGALPGPARADLLARLRRAAPGRAARSTSWSPAARSRRRSCSAATTWTAARSPRPTGRPRRWPTAPTRSPTGRC